MKPNNIKDKVFPFWFQNLSTNIVKYREHVVDRNQNCLSQYEGFPQDRGSIATNSS